MSKEKEGQQICRRCEKATNWTTNFLCSECQPKYQCGLCDQWRFSLHNVGVCTPCFQEAGIKAVKQLLEDQ